MMVSTNLPVLVGSHCNVLFVYPYDVNNTNSRGHISPITLEKAFLPSVRFYTSVRKTAQCSEDSPVC